MLCMCCKGPGVVNGNVAINYVLWKYLRHDLTKSPNKKTLGIPPKLQPRRRTG